MTPHANDALLRFAQACEQARDLATLGALWIEAVTALGFSFTALGAHVDPRRPARAGFLLHNYPGEWIERFSTRGYHVYDPVYRRAEGSADAFLWTDPDFLALLSWRQKRVLAEAREFGLRHGCTHGLAASIHLPASCSLVADTPDVDPATLSLARLMSVHVHHRAARLAAAEITLPNTSIILSPRERLCLELCARGRSDGEIATLLQLSLGTVRRHIENARRRFGVSSRIQAAMMAVCSGQIQPRAGQDHEP